MTDRYFDLWEWGMHGQALPKFCIYGNDLCLKWPPVVIVGVNMCNQQLSEPVAMVMHIYMVAPPPAPLPPPPQVCCQPQCP